MNEELIIPTHVGIIVDVSPVLFKRFGDQDVYKRQVQQVGSHGAGGSLAMRTCHAQAFAAAGDDAQYLGALKMCIRDRLKRFMNSFTSSLSLIISLYCAL